MQWQELVHFLGQLLVSILHQLSVFTELLNSLTCHRQFRCWTVSLALVDISFRADVGGCEVCFAVWGGEAVVFVSRTSTTYPTGPVGCSPHYAPEDLELSLISVAFLGI